MISSKEELREYIEEDRKAKNRTSSAVGLWDDPVWKFQVLLRKTDYWHTKRNQSCALSPCRLIYWVFRRRLDRLAVRLGFTMSYRNIGPGLSIAHYGQLTINGGCKIGRNLRVHEGVTIGANAGGNAPTIGNNVFIGTGAKVIGDIWIADDVCIGAGSVVVRSITEPGTTWAGVPAVKISDHNSHANLSAMVVAELEK